MAASFVTVNNVNYPLPGSSSSYWHGRDVMDGRAPSAALFHVLLEDSGTMDEAGRPIMELSNRIAVDYEKLEQNEALGNKSNPIASAHKKAVDAEPDKYIRLTELGNEHSARAKGLCTLFGQWVLFHQPEGSPYQPQLFVMMTPDNRVYLPGAIISSMAGLDDLHRRYSLVRESNFMGSLGINMSGIFTLANSETSDDSRIHHPDADRIHPSKRVILQPLEPAKLGLKGDGIVIRDDTGTDIILSGHVYRSTGTIQLAHFGLVNASAEKGSITFLEHQMMGRHHLLFSPAQCSMGYHYEDPNAFSPQITVISDALHSSGAWERSTVAAAKRMIRWIGRETLRSIGIKLGD